MIIAVDASGGEYAPHEIVKGAIKAAEEYNIGIALVGYKSILHVLAGKKKKLNLSIVEANQTIGFHEHPIEAIKEKPNSSIVVGVNLVRDGKADAFVSAGSTGAVLCAALLNLGKIENVERPALASVIGLNPTSPAILIDAGANADCRPTHLVQFARLGSIYAQQVLGIALPRVGLLSNGEEETKGNRLTLESHALLKEAGLNFIGNIEGNDLARGKADVIVVDGFTGNVVIKTVEGLGDSLIKLRQPEDISDGRQQLRGRALTADVGLGFLVRGIDFQEYGGACLLGVKGTIIVSHGRSQAKAVKNAIQLAKRTAEADVCRLIAEGANG